MVVKELLSGGIAGLMVDTALYPIDTVKTRLQAAEGFAKAGGFRGVYKGLSSAIAGSMPGAGLFFVGYETSKRYMQSYGLFGNIVASSVGEISACLVRCPTEIVKQRAQVSASETPSEIFKSVAQKHGIRGFYRGFHTLVIREIPFAAIQMPLWEFLKVQFGASGNAFLGGLAGAISGAIAAAATTPIDVAKTRIMTSKDKVDVGLLQTLRNIYASQGIKGCFAGIVPRTIWITIGGFVFLGSYDLATQQLTLAGL